MGRSLLIVAFALSAAAYSAATQDQQNSPANKTKQPARTLSEQEILEARELLDMLGYWVDLDATGNDVTLRHALIAFHRNIDNLAQTGSSQSVSRAVLTNRHLITPDSAE